MAEIPYLVKDLALILMVAGVVTLIFKRLKQPLVLGYIVAGFLVSPHMPYTMSVMDETDIQTWADIGVIPQFIPQLRAWNFGGAAFLGDVWNRRHEYNWKEYLTDIRQRLTPRGAKNTLNGSNVW